MKINRVFFPFHNDEDIKAMEMVPKINPNVINLCIGPTSECDVISPVDEVTGNRTNVLTKIVDPMLSPLERERLLASLQRMPTSKRNSLSDEELIGMLPSRYNSTLTDNEKYADYIRTMIDDDISSSDEPTDVRTDEPTNALSGSGNNGDN